MRDAEVQVPAIDNQQATHKRKTQSQKRGLCLRSRRQENTILRPIFEFRTLGLHVT